MFVVIYRYNQVDIRDMEIIGIRETLDDAKQVCRDHLLYEAGMSYTMEWRMKEDILTDHPQCWSEADGDYMIFPFGGKL